MSWIQMVFIFSLACGVIALALFSVAWKLHCDELQEQASIHPSFSGWYEQDRQRRNSIAYFIRIFLLFAALTTSSLVVGTIAHFQHLWQWW